MIDIVDRLRSLGGALYIDEDRQAVAEGITEIERLRSRVEDLETALRIEHRNHPELP